MKSNASLIAIITFVFLAGLFPFSASGAVDRLCNVSYKTEYTWSDEVTVELTFMTGRELNKATRSYAYNTYSKYAMLWFSKDQVAILELDGFATNVGEEFDNEDMKKVFGFMGSVTATQVNSSDNRNWRIEARSYGRWVDPRVDN